MLANLSVMIAMTCACFQMSAEEFFERGLSWSSQGEWVKAVAGLEQAVLLEPGDEGAEARPRRPGRTARTENSAGFGEGKRTPPSSSMALRIEACQHE